MVTFGICNAHYAKLTSQGFLTPQSLPGAQTLTLPVREDTVYSTPLNGVPQPIRARGTGYDGKLEIVSLPSYFLSDILGYTHNLDGSYTENLIEDFVPFALLFQTEGSLKKRYVYYNCCCIQPDFDITTVADKTSVKAESLKLIITPYNNKIRRIVDEQQAVYNTWFNGVVI